MKKYFEPEMKISTFDMENVITTSGSALQNTVENKDYITTKSYKELWND